MSRKKLNPSRKAVQAKDVVFATLIHNEPMTIVAEKGVVLLQSDRTGDPYMLPSGLTLSYQAYGQKCEAIVRDLTREVILEPGEDDVFESDLDKEENTSVMPVDRWDDILTLTDELKLESITHSLSSAVSAVGGIALAGVSCWLLTTEFFLKNICYGTAILGIGVLGYGIYKFISQFRCADAKIIQDKNGNYINLNTGKTSLNGGMRIPIKQHQ